MSKEDKSAWKTSCQSKRVDKQLFDNNVAAQILAAPAAQETRDKRRDERYETRGFIDLRKTRAGDQLASGTHSTRQTSKAHVVTGGAESSSSCTLEL